MNNHNDAPARRSVVFDRIADRYDETRGGMARGTECADRIMEHLEPGGAAVELGVGTGVIARSLIDRGLHVVGFDVSRPMLERAHRRIGNRVGIADVHVAPVRSGSVDAVVTVWVLHLVADPQRVVAEIARMLKPDGVWCAISADEQHEPDDIVPIKVEIDRSLGRERDTTSRVCAWADAAGLTEAARTTTTPWHHRQSPEEVAADLETRTWSSCWDLDDATWARDVQPHIDALRALPDPARPRDRVAVHPVQVFTRP